MNYRVRLVYALLMSMCVGATLIVLGARKNTMKIRSSAFEYGAEIPKQYTCDAGFGLNESPPLSITGVPKHAKSLVIIFENPETEIGRWTHWLIFNLPPNITEIPVGANIAHLGGIVGENSEHKSEYYGPCPGIELRTYTIWLYAVDTILPLDKKARYEQVMQAMEGHIIAKDFLIGKYKRPRPEDRQELWQ